MTKHDLWTLFYIIVGTGDWVVGMVTGSTFWTIMGIAGQAIGMLHIITKRSEQ